MAFSDTVAFWGLHNRPGSVRLRGEMATRISRSTPTASRQRPRGSRLGDRLRQLRVSAGLTQTELARDRFSKEYISQIERGKTRPTPRDGRVARRAARRRRDVPRERRLERRARAGRGDPHPRRGADREARLRRGDRRVHERARRRRRDRRGRAPGPRALRRGLGAHPQRRGPRRDRSARAGARARRRAVVLRSRPRRGALPARRRPLPDLEHRDRDRALRRGARR